MQNCWSTFPAEEYVGKSMDERQSNLCEFCLEPSSPVIMSDIYNSMRPRQSSQPVPVPDSLTTTLVNSHQRSGPSQSSDYESGFGNGLSPSSNSWTLGLLTKIFRYHLPDRFISGINDSSSFQSLNSDDILTDQDQSTFDNGSLVDTLDNRQISNDDDDDYDSFEVLSFEAPPESTLYIKGIFHLSHCTDIEFFFFFSFRISIYTK